MAVVGHWIDSDGKHKVALLGFRRVSSSYTGENLPSILINVLAKYRISTVEKMGWFIANNASADNVIARLTLQYLFP
jgi:hypothetical protein